MDLISLFLPALLLTIICEFCVLSLLLRRDYLKIGSMIVLLNLLTNPSLNYLHLIHDVPVWILEFLVVFCEVIPIKFVCNIAWRDALLYSIIINAVSFLTGMVVYALK